MLEIMVVEERPLAMGVIFITCSMTIHIEMWIRIKITQGIKDHNGGPEMPRLLVVIQNRMISFFTIRMDIWLGALGGFGARIIRIYIVRGLLMPMEVGRRLMY